MHLKTSKKVVYSLFCFLCFLQHLRERKPPVLLLFFTRIERYERNVACLHFMHFMSETLLNCFLSFVGVQKISQWKMLVYFLCFLRRIEMYKWKMLVQFLCFLGTQKYLSGRCLFAFQAQKYLNEKLLVCFLCFVCVQSFFIKKKLEIGPMTSITLLVVPASTNNVLFIQSKSYSKTPYSHPKQTIIARLSY